MSALAMNIAGVSSCRARGRGRPAKEHDNSRVQAALVPWFISASSGFEDQSVEHVYQPMFRGSPWLDDILTGVSRMQSEGQNSTRPLNRDLILRVLLRCETISSASVAVVIGRDHQRAQTDRYTAAARVASKGVAAELDRRPEWAPQFTKVEHVCQPSEPFPPLRPHCF